MLVETAAEYFFLVACVLAALGLLGLPVRLGLRALAGEPLTLPTPLVGVAVAVIGGWYLYGPIDGLRSVYRVGYALGAAALVAWLIARRWTLRADLRELVGKLGRPAAIAGGTALVMVFAFGSVLSVRYPTIVTAGNQDVANYALVGQHIADQGPGDEGPIVGFDLGDRATASFDFGPVAVVVGASAAGPFDDVWRYLMPLIGVVSGLVAYSVALCLDRVLPGRRLLTTIAGIASICPFLFQYLVSQYFLNQLIAISVVVMLCLLLVHGSTRRSLRARGAFVLAAGLLVAVLVASYPHVVLFGPLLLLPPLFVADGFRDVVRRILALVVQGVAALLVGFVLLPTLALRVPDTLRLLSGTSAGWLLPGFLPAEVLGDLSTPYPVHAGTRTWMMSIVVLFLLAAAAAYAMAKRVAAPLGRFAVALFASCFVSYAVVFVSEGPSYRQWKWITQYTPVLVGTGLLLAMVATVQLLRSFGSGAQAAAVAGGVAYCVLVSMDAAAATFPLGRPFPPATVPLDLSSLETAPQLASIDELNVDVAPYWEATWVAYFLRDHDLRLVDPSAYAIAEPTATWTLQRVDSPGPVAALEVIPINATYQLVRLGEPS
jgi:hypothetical protein